MIMKVTTMPYVKELYCNKVFTIHKPLKPLSVSLLVHLPLRKSNPIFLQPTYSKTNNISEND